MAIFPLFPQIFTQKIDRDSMDKAVPKKSKNKIKGLKEEIELEKEKKQAYLRQLKYLQADFENYRKRIEKEMRDLIVRSNEKLISQLLSIVDDLERAIDSARASKDMSIILEGIEMIHKNLTEMLKQEGLEKIEALGKNFDPTIHEIVVKIPKKDCQEGLILEEVRKGFVFKGRVIRPSMVNVSCLFGDEE